MTPLLEARGLTKTYGQLRANDDVSFSIFPGEIVGIVGENGAGKSTLVKMLAGAVESDSGDIYVSGERIAMRSPADAKQAGISLVHQHFKLIESLTVEENLVLGRPELRHGVLDFKALRPGFESVAKDLGTTLQYEARVSALSVGGRQQVELVRALFHEPRLLILDEPTAVLPPSERDRLLRFVRRLKERGMAAILISHKLDDLYDCCDRAVVMRAGRVVGSSDLRPQDRAQLVRLIVGDELPPPDLRHGSRGAPVVSVRNLVVHRDNGTVAVDHGSFDLHAGEIVGLCGVEGNGQTELMHAMAGMRPVHSGEIVYVLDKDLVAKRDPASLAPDRRRAHPGRSFASRRRTRVQPDHELAAAEIERARICQFWIPAASGGGQGDGASNRGQRRACRRPGRAHGGSLRRQSAEIRYRPRA